MKPASTYTLTYALNVAENHMENTNRTNSSQIYPFDPKQMERPNGRSIKIAE